MTTVLSLNNISKSYGFVKALNGVSFDVPKGSVFGILGPNGSGKTTMLGIVMNILTQSGGSFTFLGKEGSDADVRKKVGTLLETPNFYHYLSAERNLRIAAEIKNVQNPNIDEALQKVNLHQRKTSKFSTYSLGMKQRLAIASALIGDPEVLVFDEPTNGLDPVGIAEIRALIRKLSAEGKTIIMASHLLDEVEKVCTHVAILKKGTLITSGHVNDILINEDIVEVSARDVHALEIAANKLRGFNQVRIVDNCVQINYPMGGADLETVNRHFFEQGIVLNLLHLKKKSLETKFFELTNN